MPGRASVAHHPALLVQDWCLVLPEDFAGRDRREPGVIRHFSERHARMADQRSYPVHRLRLDPPAAKRRLRARDVIDPECPIPHHGKFRGKSCRVINKTR